MQYLLQYVSSLQHWCPREFTNSGVAAISFILLRDAHVSPAWILSHSPQTIAIVCLAIALRATKVVFFVCRDYRLELRLEKRVEPVSCVEAHRNHEVL